MQIKFVLFLQKIALPLLLILLGSVTGKNSLRIAYEWKEIDYKYADSNERWSAIENFQFKPNNVIPFGIEIYRNRLFVTLPRWRGGVPATLAYFELNDTIKSPALIPYPSWQAHSLAEDDPELVSPFRVRADSCGRLWVLDSRISGVLENTKLYGEPQLLVYDLHNDNLLRRYVFPKDQVKQSSFFANLAVEVVDCDNTFVYAADLGKPGLVVYSWQDQESWRISHNFFHPDPLAGNFSIEDIEFQWDDGLYGLALSKKRTDGYATLYFHPLSSTMEFAVSTEILRNKTLATEGIIYKEFKILGSRETDGQAGASFLDQSTGILLYTMPNLNSVGCWKTTESDYNQKTQAHVQTSKTDLIFPSDLKVDEQQRLWVLTNRLQDFIYDELYAESVNFRILMSDLSSAVEGTACAVPEDRLTKLKNKVGTLITKGTKSHKSGANALQNVSAFAASACLVLALVQLWQ